jgi:tetratricopeptide (TPR) repeat protein
MIIEEMIKLALTLIVKPTERESIILDRCLKSVYKHVDGIYITITSKESNEEVEKVCKKYKANISYFEWINDFAAARNYNWSQVPKEYTHIFWCDADDVVRGAKKLKEITKMADERATDIVILNYEYAYDEFDNCTVKHMKSRIIKNDGCVVWSGKVHEDFRPIRSVTAKLNYDVVIEHHTDSERVSVGTERNLDIALSEISEKPDDPRSYWLAANAYTMANDLDKAKSNYLIFIGMSQSEEEKYMAWNRLSSLYKDKRNISCALQSLIIRPWYPDAWFRLGEIYYDNRDYKKAKIFMESGLTKKLIETTRIVHNPMDYTYNPKLLLAKIHIELQEDKEALRLIKECYKIRPTKALEVLIKGLKHLLITPSESGIIKVNKE